MPRTKGSKNRPKHTTDFVSQIAEKQEAIASLTSEITTIAANIDTLKADLKEKKTALKVAQKELTKLETKKAEAEEVLKKLLASGVSVIDFMSCH